MTAPPFLIPPDRVPVVDQRGIVTPVWYKFLNSFFQGAGGGVSFGTAATEDIGTAGATVPLLNAGNTWSGTQSFGSGKLVLLGSASGQTTLNATAAASGVLTLPAVTDTLVGVATADTLTNKTLASASNTIGGAQLVGSVTNDSAGAGIVGELLEQEILVGSAVGLVSATAKDVATISLTAGDWDVWGALWTSPNALTTTSLIEGWISTTSNTRPTPPNKGAMASDPVGLAAGVAMGVPVGYRRFSVAAPTSIYLGAAVTFAVNTMAAYGYLGARRRR